MKEAFFVFSFLLLCCNAYAAYPAVGGGGGGGKPPDPDVDTFGTGDKKDEKTDDYEPPPRNKPVSVQKPTDLFNFGTTMSDDDITVFDVNKIASKLKDARVASANGPRRRGMSTDTDMCNRVLRSVPSHLRFITKYNYYVKYTHAYNIPIVSSRNVGDKALKRACYTIRFLLADRKELRQSLYRHYGRVGIIGRREGTTSIPEHRWLGRAWDIRARGLGGTLGIPISTGAEENINCESADRYRRQDIFLHEFSHGIQEIAVRGGGIPGYFERLKRAYYNAKRTGLWHRTYSMSTVQEYFAEGTQSYFDVNSYAPRPDGVRGPINTRVKLKTYDPTLYNLLKEVFPCGNKILKRCDTKSGVKRATFKMDCNPSGQGRLIQWVPGGTGVTVTVKPDVTTTKSPPIPPTKGKCKPDTSSNCPAWAKSKFCLKGSQYAEWMNKHCQKSCGLCKAVCVDTDPNCYHWPTFCKQNDHVIKHCKKTCNTC